VKEDDIHVAHYANEKEQGLKYDVVHIDFYMLSIKPGNKNHNRTSLQQPMP
jgi:hypothetical protein